MFTRRASVLFQILKLGVLAAVLLFQLTGTLPAARAATYTVINTSDSGPGSLRQAILDANANAGVLDTIEFNIPPAQCTPICSIALASELPVITDPVIIDGTTQPGFAGSPLIELDGSGAGANADGLRITAGGTTVQGLVINRFSSDGIEIDGGSGNTIQGNYIGTDATGTAALGNSTLGIRLYNGAANNLIGGTTAGARNVIAGSGSTGIWVYGSGTNGNRLEGNYVGTNASGTAALSNGGNGVTISDEATNNTIGGTTPGAGNLISGNNWDGINLRSNSNLVQGNFVGTNASGTAPLGNGFDGVFLSDEAANNTIGGADAAARNVISGNSDEGIELRGANGNLVQGNFIGTNASGTAALGNGSDGVLLSDGAANNAIGGTEPGSGNRIAFNTGNGVNLDSGTGNSVLSNAIYANIGLGIALNAAAGANNGQAAPILTAVIVGQNTITIEGTLNSVPGTTFTLQFFANPTCDPSGFGEGATLLTTTSQTTDGAGALALIATLPLPAAQFFTATATDPGGNTSAFSNCLQGAVPLSASTPGAALPTVPLCADLSGQANSVVRADIPSDTITGGSVFCRVLAENGEFKADSAQVGDAALLAQGVVHAVDIFGLTYGGLPVTRFNYSVKACLQGSGTFYYLDATTSPRTSMLLPTTFEGGFTCALIPNAGIVVLTGARSTAPPSGGPLAACTVTTTAIVNLRDGPGTEHAVITLVPYDTRLQAAARQGDWFQVSYLGRTGWVNAGYVTTAGQCQ